VERIIIYDKVCVPMIVDYKWQEAKCEKLPKLLPSLFPPVSEEEQDRRFEVLHKKHAKPIFDVFMELGGFYYKSGQKIAVRRAISLAWVALCGRMVGVVFVFAQAHTRVSRPRKKGVCSFPLRRLTPPYHAHKYAHTHTPPDLVDSQTWRVSPQRSTWTCFNRS
jgi:hypothetical protein